MIPHSTEATRWQPWMLAILCVMALGVFLRVSSFEKLKGVGFDENVYRTYVERIVQTGPLAYPELINFYLTEQKKAPIVFLPPTRVTFLLAASGYQKVFGVPTVEAIRATSCFAAVSTLIVTAIFAWRLGGLTMALAMTALMSVAPTQISMAHRALIDGFFGLFALVVIWSLWEALQNPKSRAWLWTYGVSLCLMVLTKENAAFVYLAVLGLLFVNRWLHFGRVSWPLLAVTLAGPAVGVLLLALCAGSLVTLYQVFDLNVRMNYDLPYAFLNQDGPWFRYIIDLLLISPLVMLFAIGGAFLVRWNNKAGLFLLAFLVFSYLVMGNLRYGINLRFANMWDFPLRWLALVPILVWKDRFATSRKQIVFVTSMVGILCLFEFSSYLQIFVDHEVYDPISLNLMRALDMIKSQQ